MEHSQFRIGLEFYCGGKKWRCTDVGSRVIVAIQLGPREVATVSVDPSDETKHIETRHISDDASDLNGPPYSVAEFVFEEYDFEGCHLEPEEDLD
jgi:hypothetical protein